MVSLAATDLGLQVHFPSYWRKKDVKNKPKKQAGDTSSEGLSTSDLEASHSEMKKSFRRGRKGRSRRFDSEESSSNESKLDDEQNRRSSCRHAPNFGSKKN